MELYIKYHSNNYSSNYDNRKKKTLIYIGIHTGSGTYVLQTVATEQKGYIVNNQLVPTCRVLSLLQYGRKHNQETDSAFRRKQLLSDETNRLMKTVQKRRTFGMQPAPPRCFTDRGDVEVYEELTLAVMLSS